MQGSHSRRNGLTGGLDLLSRRQKAIAKPLGVVAVIIGLVELGAFLQQPDINILSALVGAYVLGMMLPHRGRVKIPCPQCGRINLAKAKRFIEGDTFACKGCGKTLIFTNQQTYNCGFCERPFKSPIRPKRNELIRLECSNCGKANYYGMKTNYSVQEVKETLAEKRP